MNSGRGGPYLNDPPVTVDFGRAGRFLNGRQAAGPRQGLSNSTLVASSTCRSADSRPLTSSVPV